MVTNLCTCSQFLRLSTGLESLPGRFWLLGFIFDMSDLLRKKQPLIFSHTEIHLWEIISASFFPGTADAYITVQTNKSEMSSLFFPLHVSINIMPALSK